MLNQEPPPPSRPRRHRSTIAASVQKQAALLLLRLAQTGPQATVERFLYCHDGLRYDYLLADLLLTILKGYLADGLLGVASWPSTTRT